MEQRTLSLRFLFLPERGGLDELHGKLWCVTDGGFLAEHDVGSIEQALMVVRVHGTNTECYRRDGFLLWRSFLFVTKLL